MTQDTEEKPKEGEKPKGEEKPKEKENPSWWKKRTPMERGGIIFIIIALLAIIVLIIALVIVAVQKPSDDVCETSGCIQAAANIMKNLDETVDPCDDFYKFACGNYMHEGVIPDGEFHLNSFMDVNHHFQAQLRTIFEEPPTTNEVKPFIMMKNLYNSCKNTTAVEIDGLAPFKQLFRNLGGWPALEGNNWNQNNFEWKDSIYRFRGYGLNADHFLKISIRPDMENTSQFIIYLDQAELGINRDYLLMGLEEPHLKAEYNYMVDLALAFGGYKPIVEHDVKKMLSFRTDLAKICLSEEDRRNKSALYNPMTINELQQAYPHIYWLEFLNKAIAIQNRQLNGTQKVNVNVPEYINALEELLRQTSSRRIQANHAIFHALEHLETYLPESLKDYLYPQSTREPRWQECVKITSKSFALASSSLYARKYSQKNSKEKATQIVEDIKTEFIKTVKQSTWMDESAKEKIIEKAKTLQTHVGYEEGLHDEKLENYYSELWITPGNFLQSVINSTVFKKNKEVELLGSDLNTIDLSTYVSPKGTKLFYSDIENSLYLPAPLLQDAFFDKDRLQSMNYGSLGYYIGQEITRKLINQESTLEVNNLEKRENETNNAFLDNANCITDQYGNYSETGVNITDTDALIEIIAENAGLMEAYSAYNDWVERNGPEARLSGVKKYTAKQLFWISAASNYCTKFKNEELASSKSADIHSQNQFRMIKSLSNSQYFSDDFQCPLGSQMNTENKCQV